MDIKINVYTLYSSHLFEKRFLILKYKNKTVTYQQVYINIYNLSHFLQENRAFH